MHPTSRRTSPGALALMSLLIAILGLAVLSVTASTPGLLDLGPSAAGAQDSDDDDDDDDSDSDDSDSDDTDTGAAPAGGADTGFGGTAGTADEGFGLALPIGVLLAAGVVTGSVAAARRTA